jgi:hypothetical protein
MRRSLALIEAHTGGFAIGLELQDSRVELDDAGTPLSTSTVNPLDILQAYVRLDADGVFGWPDASLTLGRQTLGIGNQRVLERVGFANVIFSYTGAYWRARRRAKDPGEVGEELHIAVFSPTRRSPSDRASMAANQLSGDEEQIGQSAGFVQYRREELLASVIPGVAGELYIFGLKERDRAGAPSADRAYFQPGVRFVRAPAPGKVDFDIEAAWRTGHRAPSAAAGETRRFAVDAQMVALAVGYTFDHPWRPRFAVDYYYASGDKDPTDERFDQFERLFGGRRTDLGNTGIFGPLTTANIETPGFRIEANPDDRTDWRLSYKRAYLAEAKDVWPDARLHDTTGASGRLIGDVWDFRLRRWLTPQSLRLEVGASLLAPGGLANRAPQSPRPDQTLFAYAQFTQVF